MLACCPQCNTYFRVSAEQLKAARCRVRCGVCLQAFDALAHLHDDEEICRLGADQAAVPQLEFKRAEERPGTGGAGGMAGDDDSPTIRETEVLPEWTMESIPKEESGEGLASVVVENEDIPPSLEVVSVPASGWKAFAWRGSGVALLGALLAQAGWFHGDILSRHIPGLSPPLEALCKQWGCPWTTHRELQRVRLSSQDVREHPRYEKTLLVNAELVNEAEAPQPYPILQLSLYQSSGAVLAGRRFEPREYLDASIPIEEGMKPGQPVHIVLEVVAPEQDAVSYEFGFL